MTNWNGLSQFAGYLKKLMEKERVKVALDEIGKASENYSKKYVLNNEVQPPTSDETLAGRRHGKAKGKGKTLLDTGLGMKSITWRRIGLALYLGMAGPHALIMRAHRRGDVKNVNTHFGGKTKREFLFWISQEKIDKIMLKLLEAK